MSDLVLPKEIIKSDTANPSIFVLFSPPKAGKTTLLSQLEGNLIIDLEKGSKYVDALKIEVNNLEELTAVGNAIIKNKKPYKYITIDTISKLEEWCEKVATRNYMESGMGKNFNRDDSGKVLPENKWESVLSLPQGAGYYWHREAVKSWLERIYKLADHIILVGHVKDKVIDKKGKEVNAKDLDLTGKLKQIVCAHADAIGYLYRGDDDELIISFKSSDQLTCGARPNHLKGQEIKIADYNQETNSLENINWKSIYPN